jgi:hypothetical protein
MRKRRFSRKILVHRLAEIGVGLYSIQARRQHDGEREYFAAGSGDRSSMRVPSPRRSGTRISGDRLRIDQATSPDFSLARGACTNSLMGRDRAHPARVP